MGFGYQYDTMGRLASMTNTTCSYVNPITGACDTYATNTSASATYGTSGELLTLQFGGTGAPTETFTYNSLLQLTHQVVPGGIDMQYVYSAGANNGRIAQSVDGILGETVNYSYDVLNRLTAAGATGGQ